MLSPGTRVRWAPKGTADSYGITEDEFEREQRAVAVVREHDVDRKCVTVEVLPDYRTEEDPDGICEMNDDEVVFARPVVKLIGENGNVFNLIALCKRAARQAGWDKAQVDQLVNDLTSKHSYDEVLCAIMEEFEVE